MSPGDELTPSADVVSDPAIFHGGITSGELALSGELSLVPMERSPTGGLMLWVSEEGDVGKGKVADSGVAGEEEGLEAGGSVLGASPASSARKWTWLSTLSRSMSLSFTTESALVGGLLVSLSCAADEERGIGRGSCHPVRDMLSSIHGQ